MPENTNNQPTVYEVVKAGLCHGCGTCIATCPVSAIELDLARYGGVYLPRIKFETCTRCGLCYRVCPGQAVPMAELNRAVFGRSADSRLLGCITNCYSGFSRDKHIRYSSSSGGLVSSLLIYALEQGLIDGALVTRMQRDNPLLPEPFIARTRDEVLQAAGSKYCPVPANVALNTILTTEGKYAVVGLPCHLHGIRKAEKPDSKLRDRIVLHLGLFCASGISFYGTEDLLSRFGIPPNNVASLSYRGEGWPGQMKISRRAPPLDLKIPLKKYNNSRFLAFSLWRCKLCLDHTAELADISLGDAWLPEFTATDSLGTSLMITRNTMAEQFIRSAVENGIIDISPLKPDLVIKSQGGLAEKKQRIHARLNLTRALGKKVPDYGQPPGSASFFNYGLAILAYSRYFLSCKKSRWWLLRFINAVIPGMGKLTRFFKKALK